MTHGSIAKGHLNVNILVTKGSLIPSLAKCLLYWDDVIPANNVMPQNPKNAEEVSRSTTVYIWDMDETLILLKSLLDGTYAGVFNGLKDPREGFELGKHWENHILQGLHKLIGQQMIKLWNDLYNLTDGYTFRWLSLAHAILKETLGMTHGSIAKGHLKVNVLVTKGSLIPSLAKCLLYCLDDVIPANNVYSSWDVGKLQCFSWIKERFTGPDVRFCAIGDGIEECEAAQAMTWPFIKIDLQPSSSYRFPGLTTKMIESYINVIYGSPDADAEEQVNEL